MSPVNADNHHPLMRAMHKPDPKLGPHEQDKRSVVPITDAGMSTMAAWLARGGRAASEAALARGVQGAAPRSCYLAKARPELRAQPRPPRGSGGKDDALRSGRDDHPVIGRSPLAAAELVPCNS